MLWPKSAAGHVGRVFGEFSFCTSIKFDTAVSADIFGFRSWFSSLFIIFPFRSSFFLFGHRVSSLVIVSRLHASVNGAQCLDMKLWIQK